mgnify:CR=1 FL=1
MRSKNQKNSKQKKKKYQKPELSKVKLITDPTCCAIVAAICIGCSSCGGSCYA